LALFSGGISHQTVASIGYFAKKVLKGVTMEIVGDWTSHRRSKSSTGAVSENGCSWSIYAESPDKTMPPVPVICETTAQPCLFGSTYEKLTDGVGSMIANGPTFVD
jgi:hypothetical protein